MNNPLHDIILVNSRDEETGTAEKMEAHYKALLHRAFSVFIFNNAGEMLLQQRALHKYHSGGLWTNACCSHPRPGEKTIAGAQRRLKEELGFTTELQKAFDFVYTAAFDNGLTENEFDHVYTGTYNEVITPNAEEVMDYCFKPMERIRKELIDSPGLYTAWFIIAFPKLEEYLKKGAN
jgi:isopentenyl-diphosphate Delta-isomerase